MMNYRKIHILGPPGSGKSYVARRLSAVYSIPVFDLDDLFWDRKANRYGVKAPPEQRDRSLANILTRDSWIIEGVYHQWVARSFEEAELIVMLTPFVWLRHWRLLKRFIKRRLGLIPSKKESFRDFWRLVAYNHAYDGDNLRRARAFAAQHTHKTVNCRRLADVLRVLHGRTQRDRKRPG